MAGIPAMSRVKLIAIIAIVVVVIILLGTILTYNSIIAKQQDTKRT